MRILNDEEIDVVLSGVWGKEWRGGFSLEDAIEDGDRVIAKAQYQQDMKDFIEWLVTKRLYPCKYCSYEYRIDEEDIESLKQLAEG